jgi:intracellular sulfur oxidation DsrE/DsrF family protein
MGIMVLAALIGMIGCESGEQIESSHDQEASPPVMVFNITSGATEDAHAVTMALQLAGHALDDGRRVVLFFNVRGARVPTETLPADLAFHDQPIRQLLTDLLQRGAQVQVCPHCMAALQVDREDLLPGVLVADREKLFGQLGANTAVFSY